MGIERIDSRFGSAGEKRILMDAKVGTTAGWTVRAGNNVWLSTCAASTTAGTLVYPIMGLKIGDRIDGFNLVGQIESAGGAVTLDATLWRSTAAAADVSTAAISGGGMKQVTASADKIVNASNSTKTLDEAKRVTVAEGETYFLLVTATTAASTDIALQSAVAHVTPVR